MKTKIAIPITVLALFTATSLKAQLLEKKVLTLAAAEQVADAAAAEAKKRNATVVIAVVDDGGYPVVVKRLDDTQVASVEVGIGKARTAAIFRRPSKVFEDQVKNGRVAALGLPGSIPLQGGLPLIHEGKVVGAIGVSGNTPQEDEDIANAGAKVFASAIEPAKGAVSNVSYFPAAQVSKAFEKGMPLLESANYKIHASHREAKGVVEIHTKDTDIIYMLQGTATLITGGTIVEGKNIESEEIRGDGVNGGESRTISKGDVIVIPSGTPHWFTEVQGPINYYVVKVRAAN
ncbi:MAG TPA: heme-binding protein [Candidatus Binatia bacterium]|nr:heme-binding protein [Candidatus Binatia bacterium]